jgi:predicted AAA+ superfamily ATPase
MNAGNMLIQRFLLPKIIDTLAPGKVTVLYGPRQVGKTTLVMELLRSITEPSRYINADEVLYQEALSSQNRQVLQDLIGNSRVLVIDEAQRVSNIGLNLKILIDNNPHISGSASFDLASQVSEPLTGRKLTFTLYPVSYGEISASRGAFEARAQLERWMIWGGYPEIVMAELATTRTRLLGELVGSYLYRDILMLNGVRHSDKLVDLLRLLAFQIGHEVSHAELASSLGLNRHTVSKYLELLEQVFVIFRVGGFSRNLRKEVSKNSRYYFYDNGVRNALVNNYNALSLRDDVGQLWENLLMVERRKANHYADRFANTYFWRTYDQKEIDCIEEREGKLFAYEFKWQGHIREVARREFVDAYPSAQVTTITQDDFVAFLS